MGNVPTINAIPTKYNGITFRSRMEARWAVFFDELGIEWLYEAEGYQLPSGWYLPDFWLPQIGANGSFFEVKPTSDAGAAFAEELTTLTGRAVAVSDGNNFDSSEVSIVMSSGGDDPIRWDMYGFIRCSLCGKATLSYSGSCPREESTHCLPAMAALRSGVTPELAHDRAMKFSFWNPGGAS